MPWAWTLISQSLAQSAAQPGGIAATPLSLNDWREMAAVVLLGVGFILLLGTLGAMWRSRWRDPKRSALPSRLEQPTSLELDGSPPPIEPQVLPKAMPRAAPDPALASVPEAQRLYELMVAAEDQATRLHAQCDERAGVLRGLIAQAEEKIGALELASRELASKELASREQASREYARREHAPREYESPQEDAASGFAQTPQPRLRDPIASATQQRYEEPKPTSSPPAQSVPAALKPVVTLGKPLAGVAIPTHSKPTHSKPTHSKPEHTPQTYASAAAAAMRAEAAAQSSAAPTILVSDPTGPDPLTGEVYRLADQGMPSVEIARRLNQHVGKVELILALRPG